MISRGTVMINAGGRNKNFNLRDARDPGADQRKFHRFPPPGLPTPAWTNSATSGNTYVISATSGFLPERLFSSLLRSLFFLFFVPCPRSRAVRATENAQKDGLSFMILRLKRVAPSHVVRSTSNSRPDSSAVVPAAMFTLPKAEGWSVLLIKFHVEQHVASPRCFFADGIKDTRDRIYRNSAVSGRPTIRKLRILK